MNHTEIDPYKAILIDGDCVPAECLLDSLLHLTYDKIEHLKQGESFTIKIMRQIYTQNPPRDVLIVEQR